MRNFFTILRFAKPYWWHATLNVIFNILAVFFSLVSFTLFIPVLQMLFHQMEIPKTAPPLIWTNFESMKDNFYFESGKLIHIYGNSRILIYIGIIIIILYFFKNFFSLFPMIEHIF